ncbi:NinG [Vibrio phage 1.052.A._10N.286.46.C3]|nr:NinG [Vibrio phage 1.052.A._10N.286.46.C3]
MIKGTGNKKRTCKNCSKTKIPACEGFIAGVNFVCDFECANELALKARDKATEKRKAKVARLHKEEVKKTNTAHRERKKGTRKLIDWQRALRKLVQQYVKVIKDPGANCCTCGNPEATEAGHYISVGANLNLQFELTNIHPQCHECNCHNSGRRAEYDKYILARYGQDHFDWLNGAHLSLKDQFPHWSDYEEEILRYRKMLREAGFKPCA